MIPTLDRIAVPALLAQRLLALLAVLLWPALLRAVEVVGDVQIEPASATSVVVRWRTDVECGTRVTYGTVPDALTKNAEGGVTAEHRVTLTGLTPGQRYHFTVGTARKKLSTGAFTMSASPSSSPPTKPDTSPARSPSPERTSPASKPAPTPTQKAPPARVTWGNYGSLEDHFVRHGSDFSARDAEDYARQAWAFRQRAYAAGLPMKLDTDGTLRVFDPANGAFAAYNRNGTTKTYFKPGSRDYFTRQPGRPVKPSDLPAR
jgi:hypothetical protein